MKFALVIATLFAASAIAAPCTRRHVDDVTDMAPMDDANATDVPATMDDTPAMDDSTPADDTTAMDDTTPADDTFAAPPPSSSSADPQDELKKTADAGPSDNSQTAVINNDSPDKGGKGSLFGLDTSSILAGGVLGGTDNAVNQRH